MSSLQSNEHKIGEKTDICMSRHSLSFQKKSLSEVDSRKIRVVLKFRCFNLIKIYIVSRLRFKIEDYAVSDVVSWK